MSQHLRMVFDTSTLIGAVLRPTSPPRRAFLAAVDNHELCVCDVTLQELEAVLQRPKFDVYAPPEQRLKFLALYKERARWWTVDDQSASRSAGACRDPKDDKFLALALACDAATLVSSDDDLLALGFWNGISIMTPAAFVTRTKG